MCAELASSLAQQFALSCCLMRACLRGTLLARVQSELEGIQVRHAVACTTGGVAHQERPRCPLQLPAAIMHRAQTVPLVTLSRNSEKWQLPAVVPNNGLPCRSQRLRPANGLGGGIPHLLLLPPPTPTHIKAVRRRWRQRTSRRAHPGARLAAQRQARAPARAVVGGCRCVAGGGVGIDLQRGRGSE